VLLRANAAVVFFQCFEHVRRTLPLRLRIVVCAQLVLREADVVERLRGAMRILGWCQLCKAWRNATSAAG
jgi:hypothetical protein